MKFHNRLRTLERQARERGRLRSPDQEWQGALAVAHVACSLLESMGVRFTDPVRVRERWAEESRKPNSGNSGMDRSFLREFWLPLSPTEMSDARGRGVARRNR